MPAKIATEAKKIIQPYLDSIFYDKSKETMISIEIKGSEDSEEVKKQKQMLILIAEQLKKIVQDSEFSEFLDVDLTEIAVDVQFKSQGKKLSSRHILGWLKGKNIKPSSYIVVGDSPSDVEAAEEFFHQDYDVTFGYVGTKDLPKQPFKTKTASEFFDKGTVEILDEIVQD